MSHTIYEFKFCILDRFCNSFAVQPTYRAPHCCGITVTVEDDGSKRFESRIIPAEGKPLARAYDLLLPLEKRVQTWLDTPAGHLDLPLVSEDHLKAALNGSDLANFINTVQLEASGAQIASSALPNELKGLPPRSPSATWFPPTSTPTPSSCWR